MPKTKRKKAADANAPYKEPKRAKREATAKVKKVVATATSSSSSSSSRSRAGRLRRQQQQQQQSGGGEAAVANASAANPSCSVFPSAASSRPRREKASRRRYAEVAEEDGSDEGEDIIDVINVLDDNGDKDPGEETGGATDRFADLLDWDDEDEEDEDAGEDPRRLIPWIWPHPKNDRANKRRGSGGPHREWEEKTPSPKKGDVLWRLEFRDRDSDAVRRPPTDEDLDEPSGTFKKENVYLWAGLCVMKQPQSSDKKAGSNAFAMVLPLFEHRTERKAKELIVAEKVEKKYLFKYERKFAKNEAILECFKCALWGMLTRPGFYPLKDSVLRQYEDLKDFFRRKTEDPRYKTLEALEYLPADDFDRYRVLGKLDGRTMATQEGSTEEDDDDLFGQSPPYHNGEEDPTAPTAVNSAIAATIDRASLLPSLDDSDSDEEEYEATPREASQLNREVTEWFGRCGTAAEVLMSDLGKVMTGEVPSERHRLMTDRTSYDLTYNSRLMYLANNDYLDKDAVTDNVLQELLSREVFEPNSRKLKICGKTRKAHTSSFAHAYIFHCLLPEGIIRFLREKHGVGYEQAESMFLAGSATARRKDRRKEEAKNNNASSGSPAAEAEEAESKSTLVKEKPTLAEAESKSTPAEEESKSVPAETESKSAPVQNESKSAPAEEESKSVTAEVESKSAPAEEESKPAPVEKESKSAPSATTDSTPTS